MTKFIGTGVALITPFNADLSIDYNALERLVEYNIENGTEYLVVCGTTGESVTVTSEEKKQLVEFILKVNNGRLPIVLGIGGNNTAEVVNEIKTTDFTGIDAILSVSPYYSKP
ncbi:MAG: dihydrodipicolinate synthase family protein, partial [Winogradskyella sp.]|nr:dihydrodipicolinate synthase family protein [Winogradskyella sp.]